MMMMMMAMTTIAYQNWCSTTMRTLHICDDIDENDNTDEIKKYDNYNDFLTLKGNLLNPQCPSSLASPF